MALQTADPPAAPSVQVVANAFVEQYYHILHHSPELVYNFYQESSVLSRQEENGEMTSVTTMRGINAKILSIDYKNYKAEIKTADAQESYKDGVTVLVTGCLTGKDNLRKKFAQSFFLAPQTKGYFVLNDVFRYIDESLPLDSTAIAIEKVDDSGAVQSAVDTESLHESHAFAPEGAKAHANDQFHIQKPTQREVTNEEETSAVSQLAKNNIPDETESSQVSPQDDGVKNSYASIVKNAKGSPGPTKVYGATKTVRSTPKHTQKQPSGARPPASVAETTAAQNCEASENVDAQEEGHSVYVRNLPINVMDAQLEQEFKKFGPIKPAGVQVRSNKQQGTCYGFVEFLSSDAMEGAIQASPLTIGGRQVFVEIKRTNSRADGGRGRFPSERGGFRGASFGGRGNYGGGRGFINNEFGGRGEYSGRGRGRAGRGGEGYQRGRGRGGRGTNRRSIDM